MSSIQRFSDNTRINIVIENILDELCPFLEEQAREISEMTAIGKALGTGKDINALLEMILSIARRFSKADGGTLYLVDTGARNLVFNVIQNESLKMNNPSVDTLPPVPLYLEGDKPNHSNVSSYVYHTGEIVNIKDVYKTKKWHFDGTKKFDHSLKYRSRSMVVIPMRNHENDIIGILQLINAKDPLTGKTTVFDTDSQEKASALASQASVIITQQMLILEMKELFEAFIKAIAVSIDEKSKHTGGHIQRVTELALMIAHQINRDQNRFKDIRLSDDQIDELRIAALMHDTGKITTPDHIIGKATRLETVVDRIELIKTRWQLFKTQLKLNTAQQKLSLFDLSTQRKKVETLDDNLKNEIDELDREFEIVFNVNADKSIPGPEQLAALEQIKQKSMQIDGSQKSYLTEDEALNLSILKGTLNKKERDIINSHAYVSEKILKKLPWPKKLAKIPSIAGAHHEKLDGTGYPLGLKAEHLNIQARILAIADIFEALSAQDRPYKQPMTLSQTMKVLHSMADSNEVDKDIVNLFFETATHIQYAEKYLSNSQIDV